MRLRTLGVQNVFLAWGFRDYSLKVGIQPSHFVWDEKFHSWSFSWLVSLTGKIIVSGQVTFGLSAINI